jgi:hypothetical protein
MIALDEDALICDLAETYGIFDYRGLPVRLLAILSCGLREDSRIKMKINDTRLTLSNTLLAGAVDRLSLLYWAQTENGQKGIDRPASVLDSLINADADKETSGFATPEEFEEARTRIVRGY